MDLNYYNIVFNKLCLLPTINKILLYFCGHAHLRSVYMRIYVARTCAST